MASSGYLDPGNPDTCFIFALRHLKNMNMSLRSYCGDTCDILGSRIRNLRTFHLFARKWGNDYDDAIVVVRALLVEIEGAVSKIAQDLHPFCVSWTREIPEGFQRLIIDAIENVDSFKEEINRWYVKFSDCSSQSTSSCSSGDLVQFMHSILSTLNYESLHSPDLINLSDTLEEELTFLKNFIRLFTALRAGGNDDDDDRHLGQNLLTHIKSVAVTAAHSCYMFKFVDNDYRIAEVRSKFSVRQLEISEMLSEISELPQRIKAVDPQVSQIYIQSLNGLKLSTRQPRSVVNLEILQDFITSLLSYLLVILRVSKIPAFSNKDQLQIFNQGLRSLRAILEKQPKNFDEKMQDLTEDVVCDAGVVVFSLFRDAAIEVGLAQEMDRLLYDLLERIKLIRAKVVGIYPEEEGSSMFNFPKVGELCFFDFLLENLTELASAAIPKHQIQTIYEGLVFLRSFLGKIVQLRDEKEELRVLWSRVVELAYRVEFLIESSEIGDVPDDSSSQTSFDSITQEINIIKLDTLKIFDREDLDVTNTSNDLLPSERSVPIIKDEIIRLDDEATSIMNRLKSPAKKLQVVPIVGMPGLGKTTLAKLVYNDSSIMHHFHIYAWCCISQVYDQKNLLLQILNCISSGLSDKCEEDLAQLLRQNLLRKKYLIILDDVWDIGAWNILKDSFPDDKNGSRILLTSRLQDVVQDVALEERLDRDPHCLRRLSDDESWKLLKANLFSRLEWPPTLSELGTQIVKRCNGLPLMIVILTGILANQEQNNWKEIVEHCLSSSSTDILEQCNNMLEMSYRYLPNELKPCFLYFGGFPEDREHTARELTLLWIAEGFVRKVQLKSLKDEANNYLMLLINRNLVMIDKQSSTGMVRTCRVHDLLHAFCVEKAKKESFFQSLKGYDEFSSFNEAQNVQRLCIQGTIENLKKSRLYCPRLRSLCFSLEHADFTKPNLFSYMYSKLLRVLDMRQIRLDIFPHESTLMVHLRFLAVGGDIKFIPPSIANLSNLETLIVDSVHSIELPLDIWKLNKLRHLETKNGYFNFCSKHLGNSLELFNLETFFTLDLCWGERERALKKFPNIRKLKVKFWDYSACDESVENNKVLVLDSLSRLESLGVFGGRLFAEKKIDICFPLNLRKLTLQFSCLPWCKISAIGQLPNLEVLKLFDDAFKGEIWNMEEAGQFPKLRFLMLYGLDFVRWTASESVRDHFPCLEKLVMYWCKRLEEVPTCIGDVSSLQMIEVYRCSESAASSIMQIYEDQVGMGNQELKFFDHSNTA